MGAELAVASYAMAMSLTPGPTTLVLALSGARFGVRRTLPHAAGAVVGYALQVALVGLGLGVALARWPALATVLQWTCALYLLHMGWRMLCAPSRAGRAQARPLRFAAAVAVQLANPKTWLMATTSAALLAGGPLPTPLVVLMLCAVAPTVPCMVAWMWLGAGLQRALATPARQRAFRVAMAALLAATAVASVAR